MKNQKSRSGNWKISFIKWSLITLAIIWAVYFLFSGFIVSQTIKGVGKMANVDMGGDVSFSLLRQEVKISDFYIANPQPEYSKNNAISFGEIFIRTKLTIAALKKEAPIEIDEIRISAPSVLLEKDKDATLIDLISKNNIKEIEKRFMALLPKSEDKPAEEAAPAKEEVPETPAEEKKPLKIRINKVVFEDGMLAFSNGKEVSSVKLPSFTIEGIGAKEGGTTPAGAVVDIMSNFSLQTLSALKNLALDITDAATNITKDLSDEVSKQINDVFKLLK